VPFLLSAVLIGHFLTAFGRIKRQLIWVSRISGVLLIAVGLLMVTDYFTLLATYLQALTPEFLLRRM
jgi:cytochrome c-type biogenesis protein